VNEQLFKLNELTPGDSARVKSIGGEPRFRQRLLELGLVPGVRVGLVRVAPMGDPIELELRGARLSLRRRDASQVVVRRISADEPAQGLTPAPRSRPPRTPEPGQGWRVALAGNPNTGKTTLFNALTGARAKVGNYPGITVERVTGPLELGPELTAELIDVPGTYSLCARARDEQVAIQEILGTGEQPGVDLVAVVLSATTLQRSLYLLLQIQELGVPVVGVVNMLDEARQRGLELDLKGLGEHLGVPMVGVVATTGEGVDALQETIRVTLEHPPPQDRPWHWEPSGDLAGHLDELAASLGPLAGPDAPPNRRRALALWCLMSLGDDDLADIPPAVRERTRAIRVAMEEHGHDFDLEVVQARYAHIDHDIEHHLRQAPASNGRTKRSNTAARVDAVLTHPVAGLLVFALVMALVFSAIFDGAAPVSAALQGVVGRLGHAVRWLLPGGLLTNLLVDGLIAGVGSVVSFLPQILILFFFVSVLESSGFMARAAFLMDRIMKKVGLNGRAFVPLLSGFACAVPAIMATRTINNRRDRLLTMMVLPLISCSARLPVYTLIIAALFGGRERVLGPLSMGTVLMLAIYLLSTVLSLVVSAILSRTVLRGRAQPLLLELPPYRWPALRSVARILWERSKVFLKTAGTIIVVASALLWLALNLPRDVPYTQNYATAIRRAQAAADETEVTRLQAAERSERLQHSVAGRLGKAIEPALRPLGFDWRIGVGLLGSLAAREIFVATMAIVYGIPEGDDSHDRLGQALKSERLADGRPAYTPLTGVSLLVFFMIALQCLSTIAVVRQETRSWAWTGFQVAYLTGLAYVASLVVYQVGSLLGLG